ncbi:FAST kinase domain-containing protein 1, mitochondrial isoform X2 [Sitophilus oryzae]|uniref:FAST kinase domain-containing protein 1, mitochondrial isoform X1 n=1 Tax=Sitophilus oryzae TaxID=7048 RepID=A0A6J2YHT0_SITOR|nr:FAST kinase domain-containing protein 1, mitochondrial isoform X1 [Sitophilus oryzae]XP_030763578.1 FAST kinase domain-containing protein 1, mitochondrial isoform X2 [Sitophilus oryzae]
MFFVFQLKTKFSACSVNMNIYKNAFKMYQFCYKRRVSVFNRQYKCFACELGNRKYMIRTPNKVKRTHNFNSKKMSSDISSADYNIDQEATTDLYPYLETESDPQRESLWNYLFLDNTDDKTIILKKCASVEEVFNFFKEHSDNISDKHISQIILKLSDLQTLFFYHMDDETARREDFFKKLQEYREFSAILSILNDKISSYDPFLLSYVILHLHKLGVPTESYLIQHIAVQLTRHLLKEFTLEMTANLFKVIFKDHSVRPYNIVKDLIPTVLQQIEKVDNVTDLEYVTICLNRMFQVLTNDVLDRLETKVVELIEQKVLKNSDSHTILKIILLFNYPAWRTRNTRFISKCILFMEDYIELLNFTEMEFLHDVLISNQEPGDALNTIQRCSAKHIQQLEDSQSHRETRLKLFCCLIYFSSPASIVQFRKHITKYLNDKENLESLTLLRKIFSYLKVSDKKMYEFYWDSSCQVLKESRNIQTMLKLMDNYNNFVYSNSKSRHFAFEHHVIKLAKKYFYDGTLTLIPDHFFQCFSFAFLYCADTGFLNDLLVAFRENNVQMGMTSCMKMSQALHLLGDVRNVILKKESIEEVKNILNKVTERIYTYNKRSNTKNLLIKSAVLRDDYETELITDILESMKDIDCMSSKVLEGICFNLYSTDSLIPEAINKCTDYVIQNNRSILGFNAEKLLNVCYYLNYYPIYADKLFPIVTDIIIRDQERASGLSFLQAALALSYFNCMPKSFVKQIFNVEFLDRLDVELRNCYFKDTYPYRVRYILMQLNRVMCLENPEYNIPWFHQKIIDEYQKTYAIDDVSNRCHLKLREYMLNVVPKEYVSENVSVPYGYRINFVIHLDQNNRPTVNVDDPRTIKLAILVKYPRSYTRFSVQLKGQDELKNRHLEILGYKVKIIKWEEFKNLLYAGERIEFINNVIYS